ncbi:hypothetical protein fsci_17380 [Francisella sciaenopsi]|uniref:Uncharacterized protein n=1 Tax=Francisella sciaenopsi TaxID=3055034 RepID=A0ABQ6PH52_9GAMM
MIRPKIITLRGKAKPLRKNAKEVITIASVNEHNNTFSIFLDFEVFSPLVYSATRKINNATIAINEAKKLKLLKLLIL